MVGAMYCRMPMTDRGTRRTAVAKSSNGTTVTIPPAASRQIGRRARVQECTGPVPIESRQVERGGHDEHGGFEGEPFERRKRRLLLDQSVTAETAGERQPDPRKRSIGQREPVTPENANATASHCIGRRRSRKTTTPISTLTSGVMK